MAHLVMRPYTAHWQIGGFIFPSASILGFINETSYNEVVRKLISTTGGLFDGFSSAKNHHPT